MATPRRFWTPGSCFHIVNRGNRKEKIFLDDMDFGVYLGFIKDTLDYYKEYEYKIISYCLMSNHIHLLLKTTHSSPTNFMRRLNSLYARYFNIKYGTVGHLFQERYYSKFVDSDVALLEISKYIHLNPVKANLVTNPLYYRWSSYGKTIKKQKISKNVLTVESSELLDLFDIYTIFTDSNYHFKNNFEKYRTYVNSILP